MPYGRNIEGVGAAARIYFGKQAAALNPAEAITLAVIPQSPTRRAPRPHVVNQALADARRSLVDRWRASHAGNDPQLDAPPAVRPPEELPFLAPHFVDGIIADAGTAPQVATIRTTLDLPLQRLIERSVRAYVSQERAVGIRNAAVLLVDVRTMEVKAQLGSADFKSAEIEGQIDGTRARRSPGSALKPFVYALGLEQGVLHPHTMLKDTPQHFAGWAPENFDGRYVGPIAARDALIRSRNVPALDVAAKLNRPSFYDFLKTAGIGQLRAERHYGLALVLGGAEVTMEELIGLYAALANRGVLLPLRRRADDPLLDPALDAANGTRILSSEASWVVRNMLEANPRPDRASRLSAVEDTLPVAWKTGTSWGFRDAWAVGLFGPYALAVWVGEFDNRSNPAFVGVRAAAPLFFKIVDAIAADNPRLPAVNATRPDGVHSVEVCAVSGQLPTASCHHRTHTWFIPGRSPIDLCTIHRPVLVDDTSGLATCAPFGDGHSHAEVYEFWPSDLAHLFALAGLPRRSPPLYDPRCATAPDAGRSAAPLITSPLRGVTYTLQPSRATDQVALQAVTDAAAHEVYWFVDRAFVGKAQAGTALLWTPRPGKIHRPRRRRSRASGQPPARRGGCALEICGRAGACCGVSPAHLRAPRRHPTTPSPIATFSSSPAARPAGSAPAGAWPSSPSRSSRAASATARRAPGSGCPCHGSSRRRPPIFTAHRSTAEGRPSASSSRPTRRCTKAPSMAPSQWRRARASS